MQACLNSQVISNVKKVKQTKKRRKKLYIMRARWPKHYTTSLFLVANFTFIANKSPWLPSYNPTPPPPFPLPIFCTTLFSHSICMTVIPSRSWKQLLCIIWRVNKMYFGKNEIGGIGSVLSFWHWKRGFLGILKYFISDVTDVYSYRVLSYVLGWTEGTRIDQGCFAIFDEFQFLSGSTAWIIGEHLEVFNRALSLIESSTAASQKKWACGQRPLRKRVYRFRLME